MNLPDPAGPISRLMASLMQGMTAPDDHEPLPAGDVVADRDVQLALWMAYELFYRGFDDVDPLMEWNTDVLRLRQRIEGAFEAELRAATSHRLAEAPADGPVGVGLLQLVHDDDGPHLSAYLRRDATAEQMRDFLRERSVQQLKESDPQAFLVPRLEGAAKVALAEIQYDEFGAGRVDGLHQAMFADALVAVGLDPTYGVYVSEISGVSLASANVMSLFGLNRRLRGAGIGHFAAFEASSAVPSRRIVAGMQRLDMPPEAAAYFGEHVEADSVHEQVASQDLCGSFVAEHPSQRSEVFFGALCALHLDALSSAELLTRWAEQVPGREEAS